MSSQYHFGQVLKFPTKYRLGAIASSPQEKIRVMVIYHSPGGRPVVVHLAGGRPDREGSIHDVSGYELVE